MDYYARIKNFIKEKEINDKVRYLESNNETVRTYFEIGRLLVEAQDGEKRAKYGNNYSYRNLNYMRKFYQYLKKSEHSMFTI